MTTPDNPPAVSEAAAIALWRLVVRAVATGCCAALAMTLWGDGEGLTALLPAATAAGLIFDFGAARKGEAQ